MDYPKWAYDMKMHLYGPSIWEVMVVGMTLPKNGVPSTEQAQDYFRNAQAMRVITSSPCAQEFNKIRNVEVAKKIWDTQREAHEVGSFYYYSTNKWLAHFISIKAKTTVGVLTTRLD